MEEIKKIITQAFYVDKVTVHQFPQEAIDLAAKEITLIMLEEKGNSKYKIETIRLADELGFLIRLNEEIKTVHFGEGVSFNLSQIHRMVEHRKKELNTQISEINKEIDSIKKL